MNQRIILLMNFLWLFISISSFAQLSTKHKEQLVERVKADVINQGMTSTQVYKVKRQYVLVATEIASSKMNGSAQTRIAEMQARRSMGEFLKGASNRAVSVYETKQEEIEDYASDKRSHQAMEKQSVSSDVASKVDESASSRSSETFSEKDILESMSNIGNMQHLARFTNADGETVYAYFLLLSKSKAKRKY